MAWTVEKARKRIGLDPTDDSRDEDLNEAMAVALAAAESYCDRKFLLQDDVQEFELPIDYRLLVRRYPLARMTGISPLEPTTQVSAPPVPDDYPIPVPTQWRMDQKRGIIFIVGQPPWIAPPAGVVALGTSPHFAAFRAGPRAGFILHYSGGYDPLPADLEAALWMTFDSVWGSTPGYAVPGGGGAVSEAPLKSFQIDGMSLSYDTAAGSSSGGGGGDVSSFGLLPSNAIGILMSYRAETVVGGA
jgi:hypothetical protein